MNKLLGILILILLTGCQDTAYLTNTCYLEEKANTLSSKIEYTFSFKNDIIDKVNVVYSYSDSNMDTITSIKLSVEAQNKYLQDPIFEVIESDKNVYKVKYFFTKDSNLSLKEHFSIFDKRSELQKDLQKKGYTCK